MLPGVGAVGPYLQMLRQKGFADQIKQLVLEHAPFLGICVGMQALATKCEEFGTFDGLNLIPGELNHFATSVKMFGFRMLVGTVKLCGKA